MEPGCAAMIPCVYAERAENAELVDPLTGHSTPTAGPMLCGWAMNAAPAQLVNVPRWLSRNAMAGHLLNYPTDCEGCPCYEPR